MKKFLLPIALLAGAVCANAEDIYFEDNFEWLAPWVAEHNLGDPVGTNNPNATGISITESAMIGTKGGNIFHEKWCASITGDAEHTVYNGDGEESGYLTRIFGGGNANYFVFMAHKGYLRIGSQGFNAGLRTRSVSIPKDAVELYLEFDWCPCKNDDGSWHDVELDVEYRPGNLTVADMLVHPSAEDESKPLSWKHECIDLFETPGLSTGDALAGKGQGCGVIIQVSALSGLRDAGNSNFYLDNIRIAADMLPAGVTDIIVDNDRTAPVEYFNLQGVRVNNPENGIFIRRQGKKVTKVAL